MRTNANARAFESDISVKKGIVAFEEFQSLASQDASSSEALSGFISVCKEIEVGQDFRVTRERIRQIEAKALRKLRHPIRSKKLRSFAETV